MADQDLPTFDRPASLKKRCLFCAEEIQAEAIVCRYCNRDLMIPSPQPALGGTSKAGSGSDPAFLAFLVTGGLLTLMVLLPYTAAVLILIASGLWAAWDSSQIKVIQYQSGVSYSPIILFFAVTCIWIVGFPWYVYVRQKIVRAEVPLKPI